MMSRYWLRMIAMNVAAAVFVAVAFNGVTWNTPWRRALEVFGVGLLFASCIGTMCAVLVPRLSHFVFGRFRFPLTWAVLIAAMIGLGAAGSLLAILILRAIGYIPTAHLVAMWFLGSLKISIIVTLIFGVFATVMETLRTQLDETTLALRTKERDEADARRLAAEAQLASLESRVNPHFLFNTLNSIAALVHDDPAAAERVTGALASLMRSSLEAGSMPLVPLDEELRIVRAYLDIERVRFGNRLRYHVETSGDPGPTTVPRLSLQTLVENSVKYAVSPRREGASIVVRAAKSNGRLRLDVEDDGPVFDPAAAFRSGHGLALLESRLEMTYGDRAALVIDSRSERTRISIDLPSESS